MYINLVLGNQNGFNNLSSQIQNLTSDVDLYREEIISKIEVKVPCIFKLYRYIFNFNSGYGTID